MQNDLSLQTSKLNSTASHVKLLSSDAIKANKVQIDNAIEKAFKKYDDLMGKNFKIMVNEIEQLRAPIDRTINNM